MADTSHTTSPGSAVLPHRGTTAGGTPASTRQRGDTLIPASRPMYKWWVAGTVMLSAFLVVVSTSTVNVTLPPMMTAFGLNLDQAQWIITSYMIASAVLIPTVGWLGNRLGNRNLFLLSLLVFVGSSMLCGIAWSGPSLILFRVLQGIGGGPITPMVMVFLSTAFPEKQRGLAMGLYGMAAAFGPAVGPVLGGYVTEHLSWRMVFYMNVAPGILCMVLVLLVIPDTRETVRRSLDVSGLCMLVLFLVSLLMALTQGQQYGWDTPFIQRLLLIAGGSFVVFVILQYYRKEPLVDIRLYANLRFAGISLAILMNSMAFWGTGFLQTILLQRLLDYTPSLAGFVAMPGALVLAVMMLASGRLADLVDRRYIVWGGLVVFALGSYAFSALTLERTSQWIIGMIIWRYAAIPFIFTPLNTASLALLPPEKVRMGSGLINILQQGMGGAIGLAFMTTMLQRRTTAHLTLLDHQQAWSSLPWADVVGGVQEGMRLAGDGGSGTDLRALALVAQHLQQQATVLAYQDCFVLLAIMTLVVIPFVGCLRQRRSS